MQKVTAFQLQVLKSGKDGLSGADGTCEKVEPAQQGFKMEIGSLVQERAAVWGACGAECRRSGAVTSLKVKKKAELRESTTKRKKKTKHKNKARHENP